MRGYQDSDDGVLRVTVCEDAVDHVGTCVAEQVGSTTVTMELVPNAYQQPVVCDGGVCGSGSRYGSAQFGQSRYN